MDIWAITCNPKTGACQYFLNACSSKVFDLGSWNLVWFSFLIGTTSSPSFVKIGRGQGFVCWFDMELPRLVLPIWLDLRKPNFGHTSTTAEQPNDTVPTQRQTMAYAITVHKFCWERSLGCEKARRQSLKNIHDQMNCSVVGLSSL